LPADQLWWTDGDLPVRGECGVTPLVDGRAAMLAMCRAFLGARNYILLAAWDIRADLPLVRGDDVQLGPDGADGLDADALAFWNAGQLRVKDVLGFVASRGVRVGVLLWDTLEFGGHLTNDPAKERTALEQVGVQVLLDDSSRKARHIAQSLHQKCSVVDGRVAFVGGIDLTRQSNGDYDRWDLHSHACDSSERSASRSAPAHPWHDVHVRLEGAVVGDVERDIVQRWGEVAARHQGPTWPTGLARPAAVSIPSGVSAQIVRTIPPQTYRFAPKGIATICQAYLNAIARARGFMYLESQYFWRHVYLGLDSRRLGERSPQMTQVLDALAAALGRGVSVALLVPDHPNVGRRFTDDGIDDLRARARAVGAEDRFAVFTLGNAEQTADAPGGVRYRPVYVHAKVAIVDDTWWTAGSANLNSRGMFSDAEINASVLDPAGARALRTRLWMEHTQPATHERDILDDASEGLALLRARAAGNAERVRQRQPLIGHILPYLTAAQGRAQGLAVDPEHGWLDNLPGGAGGLPAEYGQRYI
jgi:phosphatidylserine/phosphatidylglycerophosphate/cardiolipin synthase-like enzyme